MDDGLIMAYNPDYIYNNFSVSGKDPVWLAPAVNAPKVSADA